MPLNRSVSLTQATIYGVGVILGAGIYALIGIAAGISGNALWFSFILGALIAALTAFSYAELSARFPKAGAESVYSLRAFNNKELAFFVGFIFITCNLFSAAAVSWGFATYFKLFFTFSPMWVAIAVIIIASIVNLLGIRESVFLNTIFTLIEALGLVLIIIFGFPYLGSIDLLTGANGATGFDIIPQAFAGVAIVFFAFIGFETIANISEEVKDAKNVVPKAIIFSLIISTIIYVLVAAVSVSVVSPEVLLSASNASDSATHGPLALVAEVAIMPGFGFWLSLIALFATFNTVLILVTVISRYIYGLAKQNLLPSIFAKINPKTKTPTYSIILTAVLAILLCIAGNLAILGNLTTLSIFLLFFIVNASLIALLLREKPNAVDPMPILNHNQSLIVAIVGAGFCAFMFLTQYWNPINILSIEVPLIIVGTIFFLLSIPVYFCFGKRKQKVKNK